MPEPRKAQRRGRSSECISRFGVFFGGKRFAGLTRGAVKNLRGIGVTGLCVRLPQKSGAREGVYFNNVVSVAADLEKRGREGVSPGDLPPLFLVRVHASVGIKGAPAGARRASAGSSGVRAFCVVCLERCQRERSGTVSCENILNENLSRSRREGAQAESDALSGSPLEKFSMRYSQNSLSTSEISGVRMATMGALWLISFKGMLLATIMPFRTR